MAPPLQRGLQLVAMQQIVPERQLQLLQPALVQLGLPLQLQRDFEPVLGLPPPPGRFLRNIPHLVVVVRFDDGRVEVLAVREPEHFQLFITQFSAVERN